MPLDSQLTIRPMKRQEMKLALEWAKNEGWNPGRNDADPFYDADPSGHFMGLLSGVPIGCISAVTYGKTFGFLGLYIVRPEYRGKGYGIQLWEYALKYLGTRNIGLDGVVARQQDYQKYGFRRTYGNLRYGGSVAGDSDMSISKNIAELASFSIEDIVKYDSQMFPAPRGKFLAGWVRQKDAKALGYVSLHGQNAGRLSGYGVIRPCVTGHKIGPLFADNEEIAEQLVHALTKGMADGNPVFIDIPEGNENALRMTKRMGMKQVFETARMYNLENPNLPVGRIYGVTTLELG
jgi:GNAT superfamily N-acetyltransferase